MDLAARFGGNLLRHRRQLGLSQERLSSRADLHRTEIGLLENGNRLPRLDTIIKLGGGLEVDPSALLEGMSWQPGEFRPGRFYVDSDAALAAARWHRRAER